MVEAQLKLKDLDKSHKIKIPVPDTVKSVFTQEFRDKVVKELKRQGRERKAEKFKDCNKETVICECSNCGEPHVTPVGCKLRICPSCRIRENNRIVKKYEDIVKSLKNPKLLTVTLKNPKKLTSEAVTHLRNCFSRLRRRKEIKNRLWGGLYAIECKKSVHQDGWNVHIHALIDSLYIPQERLSEIWKEITGNSPVVDIRKVKGIKGLKEVLNYVSKEGEIQEVKDLVHYEEVMANRKQIQTFGSLYDKDPKEFFLECRKCGSTRWNFLGLIKGPEILFSRVDIDYLVQVLTSLDTKETSSHRKTGKGPPKCLNFEEAMSKQDKFFKELEKTDNINEIEAKFGEKFVRYMERIGLVHEPRAGKIEKL